MENISTGTTGSMAEWGSDFFGTLNDMPPEPVTGIGHILEAMSTLPAFRDARHWLLRSLDISHGFAVIEAGSGNGAALSDILDIVGKTGRLVGVDPTKAFLESARGSDSSVRPMHDSKLATFARFTLKMTSLTPRSATRAQAFVADIEKLNANGQFSASFMVQAAVGESYFFWRVTRS